MEMEWMKQVINLTSRIKLVLLYFYLTLSVQYNYFITAIIFFENKKTEVILKDKKMKNLFSSREVSFVFAEK